MSRVFAGIAKTKLFDKGTFLTAGGSYDLEVIRMLLKESRKSGLVFIVEFEVIAATGVGGEKHAPGSRVSWLQKMIDTDIAFPAIKEMFVSLMDIDRGDSEEYGQFEDQIEEILEDATDASHGKDDHPLKGQRIHCDTFTKLTKKNLDFTVHQWSTYKGDPE